MVGKSIKSVAIPVVNYDYDVETELVLRTCKRDGASYEGFKWPLVEGAIVTCPDWSPEPVCGGGLHGLLRGCGDSKLLNLTVEAKWLVVEMPRDLIVDLGGQVKAPWARIVHVGDQVSSTEFLKDRGYAHGVIGQSVTAGHKGAATVGDHGAATAGYEGVATAGYRGTATAGEYGKASAGDYGTATVGFNGVAAAGNYGNAKAGIKGTATAGVFGVAVTGHHGTALAGNHGTAIAGEGGSALVGALGCIQIEYWDGRRHRIKTGYAGEGGLKPHTLYKLDDNFNFTAIEG